MFKRRFLSLLALCGVLAVGRPIPCRAQALETETARFAPRGAFEVDASYEFQTSREGTESAIPLAFEYALTDRLALLTEPVPYTRIRPSVAPGASGVGDIEVTLSGLVRVETRTVPALAVAGEVKVPTAEAPLIGSDHYDGTAYLIASKRLGPVDIHANLGYTVVGHPRGLAVHNTFDYALAGEYVLDPRCSLLAEVVGNTAALPEAALATESTVAPEISGGETVGMLGLRWKWTPSLAASLGVTVDNNSAVLLRPGLTVRF